MSKTLQKCVKYSLRELETYTKSEGSCVHKTNMKMHLTLAPYALRDIKRSVKDRLQKKVGIYDVQVDGIILAVKNIKILSPTAALRADDPALHLHITADCFVFKPSIGAILDGIVRHVGLKHIGVLIYRVFSVKIQLESQVDTNLIEIEQVISFRIKNFNFSNLFPYIEGEILDASPDSLNSATPNKISFDMESPNDSGIEERESLQLNELLDSFKTEPLSESDAQIKSQKGRKRKSDSISKINITPVKKAKSVTKSKAIKETPSKSDTVKIKKEELNTSSLDNDAETSSEENKTEIENTSISVKTEQISESEITPSKKSKRKGAKVKKEVENS